MSVRVRPPAPILKYQISHLNFIKISAGVFHDQRVLIIAQLFVIKRSVVEIPEIDACAVPSGSLQLPDEMLLEYRRRTMHALSSDPALGSLSSVGLSSAQVGETVTQIRMTKLNYYSTGAALPRFEMDRGK